MSMRTSEARTVEHIRDILDADEEPCHAIQRVSILLQSRASTNAIVMGTRLVSSASSASTRTSANHVALICGAPVEYLTVHETVTARREKIEREEREQQ